jgi:hypothetical protein
MGLNLIAHCGAQQVERNALEGVVLPPATKSHTPIAHDYFVDLIQDRLGSANMQVVNEAFALGRKGADMFGMFEISSYADQDYTDVIGFRNSHAKKLSAGLVGGKGVFVCDNLMFMGAVKFGRRHTSHILDNLGDLITDAISKIKLLKTSSDIRYDVYKGWQLTNERADHLIVDMLRNGIINTQRVEKVVQQWDAPDHVEFNKTGQSVWRLMNAATEALKGSNIIEMPERTIKLQTILDEECELQLAA